MTLPRPLAFLAWPTAWALTSLALGPIAAAAPVVGLYGVAVQWPLAVVVGTIGAVAAWRRAEARAILLRVTEVTWLGLLPAWGLLLDVGQPDCEACADINRPVALPDALWIYLLYGAAVAAWVALRTRSWPRATPYLHALVAVGVLVCVALTVQFAPNLPAAFVFGAIGAPLLAPPVIAAGWTASLLRRLWNDDGFALTGAATVGLTTVTAATGWWTALTHTCGWTLSTLTPPPQDCHYLCTVAAQGHPWLVRPLRQGVRRGQPILVNRQLAVANAFEDLLHERWPTFGRLARRTYDRLAFPVSRFLLNPFAADLVFLAMLPAQAVFEISLRILDRKPEARVDRMYR